ncbi:MAG: hypothetical protein QOI36_1089 [Pseudonocardiales bacterium]|nr:hypothetical protein [Pseudonocardiales bacterium]
MGCVPVSRTCEPSAPSRPLGELDHRESQFRVRTGDPATKAAMSSTASRKKMS